MAAMTAGQPGAVAEEVRGHADSRAVVDDHDVASVSGC